MSTSDNSAYVEATIMVRERAEALLELMTLEAETDTEKHLVDLASHVIKTQNDLLAMQAEGILRLLDQLDYNRTRLEEIINSVKK